LVVGVQAIDAARADLSAAGYTPEILPYNRLSLKDDEAIDAPQQIASLLVHAGAPPSHHYVDEEALEDYFLRLVGLDAEVSHE
jgi:ABC-2 type transport system ATP-binding protein